MMIGNYRTVATRDLQAGGRTLSTGEQEKHPISHLREVDSPKYLGIHGVINGGQVETVIRFLQATG
jgi:hypothetical protein